MVSQGGDGVAKPVARQTFNRDHLHGLHDGYGADDGWKFAAYAFFVFWPP
jgi:hypothetical protein